jgi:hypothetical protein
MYIYESHIKEFFFNKLIKAGLAPEAGDLEIISSIVFDYLIEVGILDSENVDEEEIDE